MSRSETLRRLAECQELCETGEPLTRDELAAHRSRQAAADAQAWGRIRPQPQLALQAAA